MDGVCERRRERELIQEQTYLDTAAICAAARAGSAGSLFPLAHSAVVCRGHSPDGLSMFFAPNGTNALLGLASYAVLHGRCRVDMELEEEVHPVVAGALSDLALCGRGGEGRFRVGTVVNWLAGRFRPGVISRPADLESGDWHVVDAAQAFGLLEAEELELLLDSARNGSVVVGCLQKWMGCPVPLGFAVIATDQLSADPSLSRFLAARDYLGTSLGDRPGFNEFPDTFSASLAPVFAGYLQAAFALDSVQRKERLGHIQENWRILRGLIQGCSRLRLLSAEDVCRGMLAAAGAEAELAAVSRSLAAAGFLHTLYAGVPQSGMATMRLSAQTVAVPDHVWEKLSALLAAMR